MIPPTEALPHIALPRDRTIAGHSFGAMGGTVVRRLTGYLLPAPAPGELGGNAAATRLRYRRMVGILAGISIAAYVPTLIMANVPLDRWLVYIAAAIAAAAFISTSLLVARSGTRAALAAAALNAVVVASLGLIIREYFHQVALLFALVVVGHASIHGPMAAVTAAVLGAFLVPLAITPGAANSADLVYTFIFLVAIAGVIWSRDEIRSRYSSILQDSESKFRELVERVPAVFYTSDLGVEGRWRYISPRVEELLGFPASDWTDNPLFWWSRLHPEDRDRVQSEEDESGLAPPGRIDMIEYRLIDSEGQARWVRDEAIVVAASDDAPAHWSGFLIDVTERRRLETQLAHQAFHDPLTGLANRSLFTDRVEHALARSSRRPDFLAVLFLDLDDFKTVNDGLGHQAGDELLVAVAEVLRRSIRPSDTAARLGGDEFAILLEDLAETHTAAGVAERIMEALAEPIMVQGREVIASASIGIAEPSIRGEDVQDILRNADRAMYAAKRNGKHCYTTYLPTMHAVAARRLQLVSEIRHALDRNEFRVHYQPIVRLNDGSISGFEALVRWEHPSGGLVLPDEFIPAAEETGQILAIGQFVLDEACRQARAWGDLIPGGQAPVISVNVSARQFRDASLGPAVGAALAATGLDPGRLILEITETAVMEDTEASLRRLEELKALGIRLAIDDFGTGYSSFSYLRRLPVDILKIDKSFIAGIETGGQARKLARMIVRIGQTLNLETVAEGVELPSQAAVLRRIGCEQAQGYGFARPMAARAVSALLARSGSRLFALEPDLANEQFPPVDIAKRRSA